MLPILTGEPTVDLFVVPHVFHIQRQFLIHVFPDALMDVNLLFARFTEDIFFM